MTPPVKLIESYLTGYHYKTYEMGYRPQDPQVGIINYNIRLSSTIHKNCNIFTGEIGIVITTTVACRVSTTTFVILLYADPEFKTKLIQAVDEYEAIPTP